MIIINYQKKHHTKIIHACVKALQQGKVVAYPTDTSYGLAVDATNLKAVKKFYKIKERTFTKPVHILIPSLAYGKAVAVWNSDAKKLANKFWPGPLTLVLGLKSKNKILNLMSAKSGTIGLRQPKNKIALDLVKTLNRPITATSANPSDASGGHDAYYGLDVARQFKNQKYKPDIIIDAGKFPKRKPSTLVKITEGNIEILRKGPISLRQIKKVLS